MGIEPITLSCWIRSLRCVVTPSATGVRNSAVRGASYGKVRQLVQALPKDRYRPGGLPGCSLLPGEVNGKVGRLVR
jgi:hypothetical protein